MHPSYLLLLGAADSDPSKETQVPEDVSEWLFHIGFWDEFNRKNQTQFAQYEEEVLPTNMIADLMGRVRALLESLANQSTPELRFLYGWGAGKNELYCSVSSRFLSESLARLLEFLDRASNLRSDIYCQL